MATFTDDIDQNLEIISELIRDMPPQYQARAKAAAIRFEQTWDGLRRDFPKDPAVALGAAWAIHQLAQRMVAQDKEAEKSGGGLIQLLS